MEARGFLAGALVRFATHATHKKPAVGVGSRRRGSLPTLFTTLQPRGQCDVPPAFSHTTAIAIPGCIFNVNENGRRTVSERGVMQRSSSRTPHTGAFSKAPADARSPL